MRHHNPGIGPKIIVPRVTSSSFQQICTSNLSSYHIKINPVSAPEGTFWYEFYIRRSQWKSHSPLIFARRHHGRPPPLTASQQDKPWAASHPFDPSILRQLRYQSAPPIPHHTLHALLLMASLSWCHPPPLRHHHYQLILQIILKIIKTSWCSTALTTNAARDLASRGRFVAAYVSILNVASSL